jgi:hypothetical protein
MKKVRFDLGCGRSILLALIVTAASALPSQAQTRQATLVGLGLGDSIYSWYYDFEVFSGIILVDIDGAIHDTYCIDLYVEIGLGDVLLVDGPLTDARPDVDWCAINYLLSHNQATTYFDAAAIQAAVWYFATEPYGPYNPAAPLEKYQFMTDPTDLGLYDGWSSFFGSGIRDRAYELIASVPRDLGGNCLGVFPTALDLTPDATALRRCPGQVQLTATVYDQNGQPMPGMTVHFTTAEGALTPDQVPASTACAGWPGGVVEVAATTGAGGQASLWFTTCGGATNAEVHAWVEGNYGSLLYAENGDRQSLTTISMLPFSVADSSTVACNVTGGGGGAGATGCSHGFWKTHPAAWQGFQPTDLVQDIFDIPDGLGIGAADTLMTALDYKGGKDLVGAAQILLVQAVAALLNASHPDLDFAYTPDAVLSQTNVALASGDRQMMIDLAGILEEANKAACH